MKREGPTDGAIPVGVQSAYSHRGVAVLPRGIRLTVGSASAAFEGVKRIGPSRAVRQLGDRAAGWAADDLVAEEKPGAADANGTVQLALARFSSDNGVTWTKPQFLFEFPA